MNRRAIFSFAVLTAAVPSLCFAQSGPTQPRSGLGDAGASSPFNSFPAGGVNATTGPQAKPAYPSGSTTPNPGAAFVRTRPVPSTGALAHPPGEISTTRIDGTGKATKVPSSGVGEASRPPR